jgi:Icc-related predicted phosphoesterase
MRLVLISDTHQRHDQLTVPDGDVLVHAGDFSTRGGAEEVARFASWMRALPHRHKIVIAGNHDFLFEREPAVARSMLTHVTYLEDSGVTIEGLRFWGSPWQPRFFDWAFNLDRGVALKEKWDLIPTGIDVLIVHGPPRGVLDRTWRGEEVGCEDLREALGRIKPRLFVCGHIHEAYGEKTVDGTRCVNASCCDVRDRLFHAPVVVDW